MFEIQNHGPLILSSNYWELPEAVAGKFLVSLNAGAFRLLIPANQEGLIPELQTAKGVAISRGPWPAQGLADAFEVLFDDGTSSPYALHCTPESFDRLPTAENVAGEWIFTAWTQPRRGKPRCVLERPCRYRLSPKIPDLRPWGKS